MLQKAIRTAINEAKMQEEGFYLNYQYDFSIVKSILVEHPELVDSQDEDGNTLLHHLADPRVVVKGLGLKEVLQHNPNPYVKNKYGLTPRLVLLAEENCVDKNYEQELLSAYEQSYISTETGKIFQGLVLLMTQFGDDKYIPYQEDMAVSVMNLLGVGNQKLNYMREQHKAENKCLSAIRRKKLIENTLSNF